MSIWRKLVGTDQDTTTSPQEQPSLAPSPVDIVDDEKTTQKIEQEDIQMPNELITSDNLSPELLKSVFDAAYMDSTLEDDGELIVQDVTRVRVRPSTARR